jgi:hypothetical protein
VRREMSSLKSELYSKFGDNINLENEEDWVNRNVSSLHVYT